MALEHYDAPATSRHEKKKWPWRASNDWMDRPESLPNRQTPLHIPDDPTSINFAKLHRQSRHNLRQALSYREELLKMVGLYDDPEYNHDLQVDPYGKKIKKDREYSSFTFFERLWVLLFGTFHAGIRECDSLSDDLDREFMITSSSGTNILWNASLLLTLLGRKIIQGLMFCLLYPLDRNAAYSSFDI